MTIAGVAAVVLLAGAVGVVRLAAGCTPGVDCGYVSGYDSPQTLVLVDVDGLTLRVGWQGCADYAALQAVERPDEVVLRVYWRSRRTFRCAALVDDLAALSLNYQVRLSAPLGARRLVGPDGAALPWLDEATMLRFTPPVQMSGLAGLRYRGPAYWWPRDRGAHRPVGAAVRVPARGRGRRPVVPAAGGMPVAGRPQAGRLISPSAGQAVRARG